jgi:hypothetical protein
MSSWPRLVVGEGGLEPPRPEGHWHLKPARLPFRHSPEQRRNIITTNFQSSIRAAQGTNR